MTRRLELSYLVHVIGRRRGIVKLPDGPEQFHAPTSANLARTAEGNAFMKQGLLQVRSRLKPIKIGQRLFGRKIPTDRETQTDETLPSFYRDGLRRQW